MSFALQWLQNPFVELFFSLYAYAVLLFRRPGYFLLALIRKYSHVIVRNLAKTERQTEMEQR